MTATVPQSDQWYVQEGTNAKGPYSLSQLAQQLQTGALAPSVLVWRQGAAGWQPLATVLQEHAQPAVPPSPPSQVQQTAAVPTPSEGGQWFAMIDGQRCGPFTEAQLQELKAGKRLQYDTQLWRQGMGSWDEAREIFSDWFGNEGAAPDAGGLQLKGAASSGRSPKQNASQAQPKAENSEQAGGYRPKMSSIGLAKPKADLPVKKFVSQDSKHPALSHNHAQPNPAGAAPKTGGGMPRVVGAGGGSPPPSEVTANIYRQTIQPLGMESQILDPTAGKFDDLHVNEGLLSLPHGVMGPWPYFRNMFIIHAAAAAYQYWLYYQWGEYPPAFNLAYFAYLATFAWFSMSIVSRRIADMRGKKGLHWIYLFCFAVVCAPSPELIMQIWPTMEGTIAAVTLTLTRFAFGLRTGKVTHYLAR